MCISETRVTKALVPQVTTHNNHRAAKIKHVVVSVGKRKMAGRLVSSLGAALQRFEDMIANIVLRSLQPGLCVVNDSRLEAPPPSKPFAIQDIWKDGLLWGVPKHRRSLEKRLNRKFGFPKYNWKPLVPKTNLIVCRTCGHFNEAHTICGHCYEKVKAETTEIQEAMKKEFKLDPIKDEIVVTYDGEEDLKAQKFWKNQRIIEMPKKRPSWFHQNLLEPTSQKLSDGKEVKPNDLA